MVYVLFYHEDPIHNTLKLFPHVFSRALHVCITVSVRHSSPGAILLKISVSSFVSWAVAGVQNTIVWEAEAITCLCLGVYTFVEEGNTLLVSSMPTLYIPILRDHLTQLGPSLLCPAVLTTCKQGDMQVFNRGSQRLKRKLKWLYKLLGIAWQVHTAWAWSDSFDNTVLGQSPRWHNGRME